MLNIRFGLVLWNFTNIIFRLLTSFISIKFYNMSSWSFVHVIYVLNILYIFNHGLWLYQFGFYITKNVILLRLDIVHSYQFFGVIFLILFIKYESCLSKYCTISKWPFIFPWYDTTIFSFVFNSFPTFMYGLHILVDYARTKDDQWIGITKRRL